MNEQLLNHNINGSATCACDILIGRGIMQVHNIIIQVLIGMRYIYELMLSLLKANTYD